MASKTRQKAKEQNDIALQNYCKGCAMVECHPIFAPLYNKAIVRREKPLHSGGLAVVFSDGYIECDSKRRAAPEEWARALAHCLLHLGMGHFLEKENPVAWNISCDCVIEKFLSDFKFGKAYSHAPLPGGIPDEERLYMRFIKNGIPAEFTGFGTAGNGADMRMETLKRRYGRQPDWPRLFAAGLACAVQSAVNVAGGVQTRLEDDSRNPINTKAYQARQWFISSYPLLGAVAAGFKLVEDAEICQRLEISIAAISSSLSEIYINPAAALTREECRFVMAHELLHAALRHDIRHEWRDAYLWNVACDYVINAWLTEMGVGERPDGLLYDEQFKGLHAEAVYDRIVTDMRQYRKLATLRGVGLGDVLPGDGEWWQRGNGVDLDAFYRRALAEGLSYHQEQGRGTLPEGLIEEIRALSHPPVPWDVELARWFDEQFVPLEKTRSYARPSRRKSSTPDIPRPSWVQNKAALDGRTFGVVLDTSGSMPRYLLAAALGAIASYSAAREVPAARVVFCDAAAYDAGYMRPDDIAGRVKVKGRGGTVLQPGIRLLLGAEDFPKDAPILVITDAGCENRLIFEGREHAFLVPRGASLPFVPKGKVFRMQG